MAVIQQGEARRLAIAGVVCALIGGAVIAALIVLQPSLGFRFMVLGAILLGVICTKIAEGVSTFTGYILLIPLALTPLAILIGLAVAAGGLPEGDNPAWFILGVPILAFFGAAAVTIKMDD